MQISAEFQGIIVLLLCLGQVSHELIIESTSLCLSLIAASLAAEKRQETKSKEKFETCLLIWLCLWKNRRICAITWINLWWFYSFLFFLLTEWFFVLASCKLKIVGHRLPAVTLFQFSGTMKFSSADC